MDALAGSAFTAEELNEIDGLTIVAGNDLWTRSRLAVDKASQRPQ